MDASDIQLYSIVYSIIIILSRVQSCRFLTSILTGRCAPSQDRRRGAKLMGVQDTNLETSEMLIAFIWLDPFRQLTGTLDQKVVTPKCLFLEESMKIQMYPNGLRLGFTNSFKLPVIKKTPSNPTSWQVGLAVKATIRAAGVSASKTFPQVTGSDQKRTDVNIWKKARRFPTWEIFRYQFCLRGGCKML